MFSRILTLSAFALMLTFVTEVEALGKLSALEQETRVYGVRWRKPVVRTGVHRKVVFSSGSPVVSSKSEALYVATGEGDVMALAADGGDTLWLKNLGVPFETSMSLIAFAGEERLVLSAKNGQVFCLDAATGKPLWDTRVHSEVGASWQSDGTLLYGVTMSDRLIALSIADGTLKWQKTRNQTKSLTIQGSAQVLIDGEKVYAGFSDGYLEAYAKDSGKRLWSRFLSVDGREFLDIDADIFIQDGRLFAASYSDGVYALDPESGRVFWRQERSAVNQLLLTKNNVIALSADGYAESFALADGKSLFKTTFPRGAVARPVRVADGVFFSVGGVGFVALNVLSGEPLQKSNFGDESLGDLCVLGTRLFSFASSGYVYALDLASDSYVVL